MAQNDQKWFKIGQNLEIHVPKWYTEIVMNFKVFLEVEVQDKKWK